MPRLGFATQCKFKDLLCFSQALMLAKLQLRVWLEVSLQKFPRPEIRTGFPVAVFWLSAPDGVPGSLPLLMLFGEIGAFEFGAFCACARDNPPSITVVMANAASFFIAFILLKSASPPA